jgi:hypothetical protein
MSALCIIGIDPDLSGAIAFYFPEAPDRKKDHGKSEAALLALYGAITEGGER